MTPYEFRQWRQSAREETPGGWTQRAAAEMLGVSPDTVKSWELGRRPISPLVKWACKGVDTEWPLTENQP